MKAENKLRSILLIMLMIVAAWITAALISGCQPIPSEPQDLHHYIADDEVSIYFEPLYPMALVRVDYLLTEYYHGQLPDYLIPDDCKNQYCSNGWWTSNFPGYVHFSNAAPGARLTNLVNNNPSNRIQILGFKEL